MKKEQTVSKQRYSSLLAFPVFLCVSLCSLSSLWLKKHGRQTVEIKDKTAINDIQELVNVKLAN
jgi:hypothetical protein